MLMKKMQNKSGEEISKSQIKEIKHEIKDLKKDIKSELTKNEYKTIKKELKHEFKALNNDKSKLTMFNDNDFKSQKNSSASSVVQPQSALRR
jgi:hypothetical protein